MKTLVGGCMVVCLVGCGPVPGSNARGGGAMPEKPSQPTAQEPTAEQPVHEKPVYEPPKPEPVKTTFDDVDEAITMLGLAVAVDDKDQIVAADAWLKGQGASAVPSLLAVCKDDGADLGLRLAACRTLGGLGPAATEALIELTDSETQLVRHKAATYLGVIRPSSSRIVDVLIGMLEHKDVKMRQYAIEGIGKIGTAAKRAGPKLQEILNSDADERLRDQAADAIRKVVPRRTMDSD